MMSAAPGEIQFSGVLIQIQTSRIATSPRLGVRGSDDGAVGSLFVAHARAWRTRPELSYELHSASAPHHGGHGPNEGARGREPKRGAERGGHRDPNPVAVRCHVLWRRWCLRRKCRGTARVCVCVYVCVVCVVCVRGSFGVVVGGRCFQGRLPASQSGAKPSSRRSSLCI